MSRYSPYSDSTVITYDDNSEPTMESNLDIPLISNTTTHVIREGETLASIAFQYYGDSGYWGRIAHFNNILNPFDEVYPNKQIYIP